MTTNEAAVSSQGAPCHQRLGLTVKNRQLVWVGPENDIVVNRALLDELVMWMPYLLTLFWVRGMASFSRARGPTLNFWPATPSPWYLLIGAAAWGGVSIRSKPTPKSHTIYFDDITVASAHTQIPAGAINGRCVDIRKSHVAGVFEAVFGYPLALDPMVHHGAIIEKPETNGAHAGRIVIAPLLPVSGYVYQILVDTADANNQCQDLRTPCLGGRPVLVWRKTKAPSDRFAIQNQSAKLMDVDDIFSEAEIALIVAFNAKMGLDCGGLDILRDRNDGRIYIVDVNKTDLGPLIALSWTEKMASMNLLGQALRAWLIARDVEAHEGKKT